MGLAADAETVTPRLPAMVVRLLVLVSVWLLGTSTLSLAQENQTVDGTEQGQPAETQADESATVLVVPDVHGLPYVFAKGVLEDAGFSWKVKGKVEGFATNLVVKQSVKPGAKVLDGGAPKIVLELKPNPDYEEQGLADNSSSYPGTKLVLASDAPKDAATAPEANASSEGANDASDGAAAAPSGEADPPAAQPEPAENEPADVETADYEQAANTVSTGAQTREPAFVVAGAPREPLDKLSLPDRANKLRSWAGSLKKLTPAALDHFTYQHAWVVTGAEFGWWGGAEALRILVATDTLVQHKFGVGAKYKATARAALSKVERKIAGR